MTAGTTLPRSSGRGWASVAECDSIDRLTEAVKVLEAIYGRTLTPAIRITLLSDLAIYPEKAVLEALGRCRRELRFFPTPADIIARIDDGRPGPEEAWSLIPKSEQDSVVWTPEMREAHARIRGLLEEGDLIPARKAFTEAYAPLLARARSIGRMPTWEISKGLDASGAERVVRHAIDRGRIQAADALPILPDLTLTRGETKQLLLAGPESGGESDEQLEENRQRIQEIRLKVLQDAPHSLMAASKLATEGVTPTEPDQDALERRREELRHQAKLSQYEDDVRTANGVSLNNKRIRPPVPPEEEPIG